jgi:two-component system, NtrC family, nitrogen regulation response regulator NtrX
MSPPSADGAPAAPTILVVDDERNIRRTLDLVLRGEGYQVVDAPSAERAAEILEGGEQRIDLALVDIMLPGMSGLELLARLRDDEATRELPVVVISGTATLQDAVQAIKLGASDLFEKPLNRERVLVGVKNALRASELTREVAALSAELEARRELVGESAAMVRLLADVDRVAPTRASVLITGESGTGKELVSRALHKRSARARGPFVKVSCAAIARELIESELFGHVKGAFTGASSARRGLFDRAHGGTLFLDDIGEMDLGAQAKVLRAVQSGEMTRVGGEHAVHVDVRVVSATSKDLAHEVAGGRFREDLYFRLAVFPIHCPPLRERKGDVRALSEAFLAAFCKENGLKPKTMAPDVHEALARRRFPGNVRELRNVIERAAILAAGDHVTIADLPEDPHASPFEDDAEPRVTSVVTSVVTHGGELRQPQTEPGSPTVPTLLEVRERAERGHITAVLASMEWNIKRAAVVLGVERTNLHHKIRAYGIKKGEPETG